MKLGKDIRSLALITCTSDDVGYTAIDEATKRRVNQISYDLQVKCKMISKMFKWIFMLKWCKEHREICDDIHLN